MYLTATGQPHPRPGALQLVFSDLGTPKPGQDDTAYERLRRLLVDRGVPEEKIAFAHEHDGSDDAKARFFAACRDGRVAVAVSSLVLRRRAQVHIGVGDAVAGPTPFELESRHRWPAGAWRAEDVGMQRTLLSQASSLFRLGGIRTRRDSPMKVYVTGAPGALSMLRAAGTELNLPARSEDGATASRHVEGGVTP